MAGSLTPIGDMAVVQSQTARVGKVNPNANIDKTSKDFESMFMGQMLQPMFENAGVDPLFGGGHAEEVMKGFMVQEYGRIASKSGHLGIAAAVKSEMIKAQAAATAKQGVANVAH